MELIEQIQVWYAAQCDGDWEHQYGVSIETLDNPGWSVTIDLSGTSLENIRFQTYQENKGEEDWIFCEVNGNKFVGRGDAGKLQTIFDWEITSSESSVKIIQPAPLNTVPKENGWKLSGISPYGRQPVHKRSAIRISALSS